MQNKPMPTPTPNLDELAHAFQFAEDFDEAEAIAFWQGVDLAKEVMAERELPPAIGVSQRRAYGEKYNYWQFFENKVMYAIIDFIKNNKEKGFDDATTLMNLSNQFILKDIIKKI